MNGYDMKQSKSKEPVKLRYKKIANGNISLYLDIYFHGRRKYEFLKLYLVPEISAKDKEKNKETQALANAIKSQRIVELQTSSHGFMDIHKAEKLNFIEYLQSEVERYRAKGSTMYAQSVQNAINFLIRYAGENVTFKQVTKTFLLGYIDSLNTARGRGDKYLSASSKATYFQTVVTALNRAVKAEIIDKNPAHNIMPEDRPSPDKKSREFLTYDEVKALIATPCDCGIVKRAFLFSCFCGLRLSDIKLLEWSNIEYNSDGTARLKMVQKKTGEPIYLPLSQNAISQLPDKTDNPNVFILPTTWKVEEILATWTKKAGINKHVTYHVSRHTHATLLLTFGADIYTVSKLLGHTNIQTTQIYAKIIDDKKRDAINLIPNIEG